MRLLPSIAAAAAVLLATSAPAATVRVVPWRTAGVTEPHAVTVVRASEAALRELSTLVLQPALPTSILSKRCGAEDPGCWTALAGRAGTDYGLVLVAEPAGGLTVDLVLVDVKARKVAQRRFTAPSAEAAAQGARAAVEALVPSFLRRGYGGFLVDLPRGARLKVDGKVLLTEPSRAPVAVPNGRHEVDFLLPDGTAMLSRADVAEGKVSPVALGAHPASEGRRSNDALKATSAALWSAGTVAVVASLALATVGNLRAKANLAPCTSTFNRCATLEEAMAEQQAIAQTMSAANYLLIGGGVLAAGGGAVFTFDLVQGGGQ